MALRNLSTTRFGSRTKRVAYTDLDEKFEAVFANRGPEERKLLTQEAKLDAVLKHPKRIAQVAADIATHFIAHVRPDGFKGMVVCRDKEMCALYKTALDTEFKQKLGDVDATDLTRIAVSEDPIFDLAPVKNDYLGSDRKTAIEDFKEAAPAVPVDREKPRTVTSAQ